MAYFTRSRMVLMALEMYDYVERFKNGATDNRDMDMKVLIGFQQKALVLGEYLESMGMDYSDVVENIEKACNLVYEIAEHLDDKKIVVDHYKRLCTFCVQLVASIKDRIVEISRIDIYDFRKLSNGPDEARRIEKAIKDIYDEYEENVSNSNEQSSIEYTRSIVVGTY